MKNELTQEELKRQLYYDPINGNFVRLIKKQGVKNKITGNIDNHGYVLISVHNKRYKAHRLAFLYMEGKFPENDVDHIDGNKSNNRWNNLRKATRSENIRNSKKSKYNTTGYKGVRLRKDKKIKKWTAQIVICGKLKHIGYYETAEKAARAYDEAAIKYFGKFAKLNFNP